MPRKIASEMTPDTMEAEAMFTLAMLRADPNATDLETFATGWQARIDEVRSGEQQFRQLEADTDAGRIVGNQYLDRYSSKFGDELYLACGKDRYSSRWTKFIPETVTKFIRQGLSKQVAKVRSWMTLTDEVFEKYRADLDTWSAKCDTALQNTDALTGKRRDMWMAREKLAADLTRERDALHRKLCDRADERDLGRTWADLFFRVETVTKSKEDSEGSSQPEGTGGTEGSSAPDAGG